MPIVPRVTIKASIFPLVVRKPLMKPAPMPRISEQPMPSSTVQMDAPMLSTAAFMMMIIMPAMKAAMEPTERSIPPAVITKVAPTAMMPIKAERVSKLVTLPSPRKSGLRL